MVLNKISRLGKTLWDHKKKTAIGGVAFFFLEKYLYRLKRESDVRAYYANQALKYGREVLRPDERPRRVTVLANVCANNNRAFDKFRTNALPLLNLAGLEVTVIRTENENQLENLAAEIDNQDADALYIVGGDGTLSRVLSGIFRKYDKAPLPVGVFPGGDTNRTLVSLVPEVFSVSDKDVRRFCESAMALIEEKKRTVAVTMCSLEGFDAKKSFPMPVYGLSDLHLGWFLHMELRKKKLWYWGGLKRRLVYFWEMLKHTPSPVHFSAVYEEFCPGCSSCRPVIVPEKPPWKWWYIIFGAPAYQVTTAPQKDFSKVINKDCHKQHRVTLEGADILLETAQSKDISKILVKTGGALMGRFDIIREGWKRCKVETSITSPNSETFYEKILEAKAVTLTIDRLPDLLRKLSVFGEIYEINGDLENKQIRFEATNKKLEIYLPHSIRVDINEL